jgi:signal transduction histidine kinase
MQRLSMRFTVLVMLVIALTSAVFATASATWLYTSALDRARETAAASLNATRAMISEAVWKIDHAAVHDAIAGLESVPEIAAVQVSTRDGDVLGSEIPDGTADFVIPLQYISDHNAPTLLANVEARLDMAAVQNRIERLMLVQAVVFGGLMIVIGVLVRWTFRRLVDTPLRAVTEFVRRPDLMRNPIALHITDGPGGRALEFQQLETAINHRLAAHRQDLAELEDYKTTLEARVAERTRQLHLAQEEIVRTEKLAALGGLVAGVAHELNTPIGNGLTAASTAGEIVRQAEADLSAGTLTKSRLESTLAQTREAADVIGATLTRARDLVANFKQVAVDRQSEHRRAFDLDHVVEETLATLMPSLRRTRYRVVTDLRADMRIDGYPGPLGQVVTNLCDNAVRHAFEGRETGTIWITSRRDGDDNAVIEVADDGAGIAPENLRRIYDPFFTTKLGDGGSGLGMAIVHRLVTQVMGGGIEVDSTPGEGTRFSVCIPAIAPASADAGEPEDGDGAAAPAANAAGAAADPAAFAKLKEA